MQEGAKDASAGAVRPARSAGTGWTDRIVASTSRSAATGPGPWSHGGPCVWVALPGGRNRRTNSVEREEV